MLVSFSLKVMLAPLAAHRLAVGQTGSIETCVAEIVRRQVRRRFARSAEREEHVIRSRFFVYVNVPARKVETMRPVEAVVAELLVALAAQQPLHLTAPVHARAWPSRSMVS